MLYTVFSDVIFPPRSGGEFLLPSRPCSVDIFIESDIGQEVLL